MGRYDKAAEATQGGGSFLKLEAGQKAVVAFRGDPVVYMAKPFERDDGTKDQAKNKVLQNVISNAADAKPQVLDMGGALVDQLKKLDENGHVDRFWIVVERKGTGKQTKWSAVPGKEITAPQRAMLDALNGELHDLEEIAERISFKGGAETTLPAKSTGVPAGAAKPDAAAMAKAATDDAL